MLQRASILTLLATFILVAQVSAQPPERKNADPGRARTKDAGTSSIVTKMMAFNKKGDGKLTGMK